MFSFFARAYPFLELNSFTFLNLPLFSQPINKLWYCCLFSLLLLGRSILVMSTSLLEMVKWPPVFFVQCFGMPFSFSFIILLLFYWYYPFTVNISVCLYFMSLVNNIYLNFVSSLAIAYINLEYFSFWIYLYYLLLYFLYILSYMFLVFTCFLIAWDISFLTLICTFHTWIWFFQLP